MELNVMKPIVFLSAVLMLSVIFSGCSKDNNYLRPEDFATRLRQDGIRVEGVRPLNPGPLGASSAVEMKIASSGIGVYKFDQNNRAMTGRLERIKESRRVYVNGIPYPIYEVCGSFVIVGLDKNKEKHRILKSLRNFR